MPQITPIAAPTLASTLNQAASTASAEARARAIAKLTTTPATTQQETPVTDPSKVAPEEMTAISNTSTEKTEEGVQKVEGQVDKVVEAEGTAEATKTVAKPDEPLSERYAQLARQEKALRSKAQALKAREEAIKAKEVDTTQKTAPSETVEAYKARLAKDPMKVLAEVGLSYEELTQMALNAPNAQETRLMALVEEQQSKLRSLEEKIEQQSKSQVERQNEQYQQALNQIRSDATDLVSSDPNFETIKETGSVEEVVELIERTFKEDGKLLTVEAAAQAVEDFLVEEATKLWKLKKIQQKLAPVSAPAPKQTEAPKQQQMKTLTNAVGSSRQLSAKERAVLAFKGELKK